MEFLPAVIRAEYRGAYSIHLTFSVGHRFATAHLSP